jgi:hypothetical protein
MGQYSSLPKRVVCNIHGVIKATVEGMDRKLEEEFLFLLNETTRELVTQENPEKLITANETTSDEQLPRKIVAENGRKYRKVVIISTEERGETMTVVGFCSATGVWCHFERGKDSGMLKAGSSDLFNRGSDGVRLH